MQIVRFPRKGTNFVMHSERIILMGEYPLDEPVDDFKVLFKR